MWKWYKCPHDHFVVVVFHIPSVWLLSVDIAGALTFHPPNPVHPSVADSSALGWVSSLPLSKLSYLHSVSSHGEEKNSGNKLTHFLLSVVAPNGELSESVLVCSQMRFFFFLSPHRCLNLVSGPKLCRIPLGLESCLILPFCCKTDTLPELWIVSVTLIKF